MKNKIGCTIPVYCHFDYLLDLIPELLAFFDEKDIVIVNDGSAEFSEEELKLSYPEIGLITHPENRGKGAALISGLKELLQNDYQYAVCMDGDGQHSPLDLPGFIENSGKADLLIGMREFKLGQMPFMRILSNIITSQLIRWISRLPVRDSQNGFRLIDIDAVLSLGLSENGFQFESEMLILAGKKSISLVNIPVRTIYNDAGSSINHFSDTWKFIKLIIKHL